MSAGQPPEPETPLTIYSVGHSNQSLEAFIALLQRHGIQSLADVRSAPYSRYVPHFNRPELEYAVERAGIRYLYLGDELGGRPAGKEFYDDEGYVLYFRAARAPFFVRALAQLPLHPAEARRGPPRRAAHSLYRQPSLPCLGLNSYCDSSQTSYSFPVRGYYDHYPSLSSFILQRRSLE